MHTLWFRRLARHLLVICLALATALPLVAHDPAPASAAWCPACPDGDPPPGGGGGVGGLGPFGLMFQGGPGYVAVGSDSVLRVSAGSVSVASPITLISVNQQQQTYALGFTKPGAGTQTYVSVGSDSALRATATSIGPSETFTVQSYGSAAPSFTFRSSRGTFVSVDSNTTTRVLQATAASATPQQAFSLQYVWARTMRLVTGGWVSIHPSGDYYTFGGSGQFPGKLQADAPKDWAWRALPDGSLSAQCWCYRFLMYDLHSSGVALQSEWNNLFVSAELGYGWPYTGMLRARSSTVGPWERFDLAYQGGNFMIRSEANGLYVAAELGYGSPDYGLLRARSDVHGDWETFAIGLPSQSG
jgi:hypothetical protein